MQSLSGSSEFIDNIVVVPGAPPSADVIFQPFGEDGTPAHLNTLALLEHIQRASGQPLDPPDPDAKSHGYSLIRNGQHTFCLVVTTGHGEAAELIAKNLRAALQNDRLSDATSLWIPLLGTETGNLALDESQAIIFDALAETGWRDRPSVQITIAPPITRPAGLPQQTGEASRADAPDPVSSASVFSALDCAAALEFGRIRSERSLSSATLVFALAESPAATAFPDLKSDSAAARFSGAVHSLAGERFREIWYRHFIPGYTVSNAVPVSARPQFSADVESLLQSAGDAARTAGRSVFEIEDVVDVLLRDDGGRTSDFFAAMGIAMDALRQEYRDAYAGEIGKTLLNDVAAEDDRLGYDSYAEAIKDFLTHATTPPPLSISIQAPWGVGKSSLMQQIRNKLDPKSEREKQKSKATDVGSKMTLRQTLAFMDRNLHLQEPLPASSGRLWTVWFNAWKYDTTEQVWAGLVDAIVTQISARLSPLDRELFLLRLQLARIDDGVVRRKIYERVVTIWWGKVKGWAMAGAAAIVSLFGASAWLSESQLKVVGFSPLVLAIYLLGTYRTTSKKTQDEPASFSLAEYLKVPDYDQKLGTIHHIHQDLLRVLAVTPYKKEKGTPSPIVIFIDDLDRCTPSKVANVVEGVSMFLASEDYRCMFVIGIDPQMIAAALEEAHSKVRERLPSYERSVPLGWRFMDKFIQLPFTIPPSTRETLGTYVDSLTAPPSVKEVDGLLAPPVHASSRAPALAEEAVGIAEAVSQLESRFGEQIHQDADDISKAVEGFTESREVGTIIREVASNMSGNPREIKRVANLARLYLGLRNARRSRNSTTPWNPPSVEQYARWITLTLRWPDMMRWLQWGADDSSWESAQASLGLMERRLAFLEDAARTADSAKAWTADLSEKLGIPSDTPGTWVRDSKLFEFFQAEGKRKPDERLSAAAGHGFW